MAIAVHYNLSRCNYGQKGTIGDCVINYHDLTMFNTQCCHARPASGDRWPRLQPLQPRAKQSGDYLQYVQSSPLYTIKGYGLEETENPKKMPKYPNVEIGRRPPSWISPKVDFHNSAASRDS